ncbi:putative WblA protein [Vibrio nigripulchritudo SO65]|uniref:alpha-1,2-fucosyltransferase n=1 Tax=Vibrio nigripulchritudo TaxID=28173 RepID=UPI0003B1BEC7|nr:alpha-1,2-fucosyltransferase [Vibrio nigripulchritudo]CCN35030.1 putative WblA protein [Vibrio nigripulchritudo AM115]CCN41688.1 putative WblA protein [Vibrio nigripulchritudo FTn2]CCN65067.1 putative WblA protein [Vibrio nigripulchritudo POn4]CCN73997.1 putative WblA protein [Vibrio nigripulchritudo SO65]
MKDSRIVKLNGGLGNQMFQFALAFALKKKLNVAVKFDTELLDTNRTEFKLSLERFGLIVDKLTITEKFKYKGLESCKYRKICNWISNFTTINIHKGYYKEKERGVYDRGIFDSNVKYIDGYWQNQEYFNDFRSELLNKFNLNGKVSNHAIQYLKEITSVQNSVSIHVRRGDYLLLDVYRNLTLDYYSEAIKLVRITNPDSKFFIFSNDINWCKSNFKSVDNAIFVDSTVDEFDDMFLMSKCKTNIIANSTFSWWAAWLNNNSGKIVYCPKKWRNDTTEVHKGLPEGWNIIDK